MVSSIGIGNIFKSKKPQPDQRKHERAPMEITPLIPDEFNGPIKRLSCTSCHHYFYVTQENYHSLHSAFCHECSIKQVELERKKANNPVFKEALEQEEKGVKRAHSDEVKIGAIKNAVGRLVVETYTEIAKKAAKKITRDAINEQEAIQLAAMLIDGDQKHNINPIERVFLGRYASEDYKKRDEQGRIILQLIENTVHETRYNDHPDTKYSHSVSYWKVDDKRTQKNRPDLVAWAESVRKKAEDADNKEEEEISDQSD